MLHVTSVDLVPPCSEPSMAPLSPGQSQSPCSGLQAWGGLTRTASPIIPVLSPTLSSYTGLLPDSQTCPQGLCTCCFHCLFPLPHLHDSSHSSFHSRASVRPPSLPPSLPRGSQSTYSAVLLQSSSSQLTHTRMCVFTYYLTPCWTASSTEDLFHAGAIPKAANGADTWQVHSVNGAVSERRRISCPLLSSFPSPPCTDSGLSLSPAP